MSLITDFKAARILTLTQPQIHTHTTNQNTQIDIRSQRSPVLTFLPPQQPKISMMSSHFVCLS